MKIGIIGAMKEEVEILQHELSSLHKSEKGGCVFFEGTMNDQEIVLLESGIGKVNAAIGTTLLIDNYAPDVVINTGSAGGFDPALKVGDLVISTEVRYNDVDATVFGYEFGQVPQMPASYPADKRLINMAEKGAAAGDLRSASGLILSGDSFMSSEVRVDELKEMFQKPLCSEMEAGAIAQVCHRFQVPFVVTRSLSDIAGAEAKISYDQFLVTASKHSAELVMHMVGQLAENNQPFVT